MYGVIRIWQSTLNSHFVYDYVNESHYVVYCLLTGYTMSYYKMNKNTL